MSGETPVPGSALHRHPQGTSTNHARLPQPGLPFSQNTSTVNASTASGAISYCAFTSTSGERPCAIYFAIVGPAMCMMPVALSRTQ